MPPNMWRDFRKSVSAASKKPVPSLQFETGAVFENLVPRIWNPLKRVIDFQKPRPSQIENWAPEELGWAESIAPPTSDPCRKTEKTLRISRVNPNSREGSA